MWSGPCGNKDTECSREVRQTFRHLPGQLFSFCLVSNCLSIKPLWSVHMLCGVWWALSNILTQEIFVLIMIKSKWMRRAWQPAPVFLAGESWTKEPGGLQSIGLQRVGRDWSDLVCTHTMPDCLHSLEGTMCRQGDGGRRPCRERRQCWPVVLSTWNLGCGTRLENWQETARPWGVWGPGWGVFYSRSTWKTLSASVRHSVTWNRV